MRVTGVQDEVVFERDGGNPDVVCRDGRALAPELSVQRGVVMGCPVRAVCRADAGLVEEFTQYADLRFAASREDASCPDLCEYNERYHEHGGPFEGFDYLLGSGAEIDEAVRVDQESHGGKAGLGGGVDGSGGMGKPDGAA